MLTQVQENKLKTILDGKVISNDEFTAFELTKLLRKSEYVMHSDVRDYVHTLMADYLALGEYKRETYSQDGWSAYRYSPNKPDTDSTDTDSTINSINSYLSGSSDSNSTVGLSGSAGTHGYNYSNGTSSDEEEDDDDVDDNGVAYEEDEISLFDIINCKFKVKSNNRVTLPQNIFGKKYQTIYTYLGENDELVVSATNNPEDTISSNKTRLHKTKLIGNNFRFTIDPFIDMYDQPSVVEVIDVDTNDSDIISVYLDIY